MHFYLTDLNISALEEMEKSPIGLSREVIDDLYYFSKVKVVTCVCTHTFMYSLHTYYIRLHSRCFMFAQMSSPKNLSRLQVGSGCSPLPMGL